MEIPVKIEIDLTEYPPDVTYYFEESGDQPFSIREFSLNSPIRVFMDELEDQISDIIHCHYGNVIE